MVRVLERILLAAALLVAGASAYLALDAREAADAADTRAQGAERKAASVLEGFAPTLVIQQRSDDPFTAPRVTSGAGLTNVSIGCPEGSVVVGGGFNGFDGVSIAGSTSVGGFGGSRAQGDGWLVNAINDNGGRGRIAPTALCARGEGGLRVRSTLDADAKASKSP